MGVKNEADAEIIIIKMNGIGLAPTCADKDMAMGTANTAAAEFVISSVHRNVKPYTAIKAHIGLENPRSINWVAIQWSKPVSWMAPPRPKAEAMVTKTDKSNAWRASTKVQQRVIIIAPAAKKDAVTGGRILKAIATTNNNKIEDYDIN